MKYLIFVLIFILGADYETPNFLVNGPEAKQIGDKAEVEYKRICREWLLRDSLPLAYKCNIYSGVVLEAGMGGVTIFNDGVFTVKLDKFSEYVLNNILPHEICHVVLISVWKGRVPPWFNEGCACLEETNDAYKGRQKILDEKMFWLSHELMNMVDYAPPQHSRYFYAQSFAMCNYLRSKKGKPTLLAFGQEGVSKGWKEALKSHYGIESYEQFHKEWKEYTFRKPN